MSRTEIIGDCTLYLGDCLEILPTLGKVDLVLTDPPYGIGRDGQKKSTGGHGGRKAYDFVGWDAEPPTPAAFNTILAAGDAHVIWGGNYFADRLPATGKWLVWDKGQRINQSDGELAYTSEPGALRIFTLNRVALMTDGAEHPTQKPVELMTWCLQHFPDAASVCDPYMGSGTTGVSCVSMGRRFVGIERHEPYFDIACRRVEEAYKQPRLFAEPAPKPTQVELL